MRRFFQKTAVLAAVSVLALGAVQALAADEVAVTGHISASVGSTLSVSETERIRFGNFTVGVANANASTNTGTLQMTYAGVRTGDAAGDVTITPLYGVDNGLGVTKGSQTGGVYDITGANATARVYVKFELPGTNTPVGTSQATDPIVLSCTNCAGGQKDFYVHSLDVVDGANAALNNDAWGDYVTLVGGAAQLKIGGTLETDPTATAATDYPEGHYEGTFDILVSY